MRAKYFSLATLFAASGSHAQSASFTEFFMNHQMLVALISAGIIIGGFLMAFAALLALMTAFGSKKWGHAFGIFATGLFWALPYVFMDDDAEYSKSLMLKGLLTLVATALVIALLWLFI